MMWFLNFFSTASKQALSKMYNTKPVNEHLVETNAEEEDLEYDNLFEQVAKKPVLVVVKQAGNKTKPIMPARLVHVRIPLEKVMVLRLKV